VIVEPNGEALAYLAELVVQGKLQPRIERVYQMHQSDVVEAHRHLETNRTRGKLVLSV
jgi:NADPH:quinone reductase-like Zn-dependent oxidoreductase